MTVLSGQLSPQVVCYQNVCPALQRMPAHHCAQWAVCTGVSKQQSQSLCTQCHVCPSNTINHCKLNFSIPPSSLQALSVLTVQHHDIGAYFPVRCSYADGPLSTTHSREMCSGSGTTCLSYKSFRANAPTAHRNPTSDPPASRYGTTSPWHSWAQSGSDFGGSEAWLATSIAIPPATSVLTTALKPRRAFECLRSCRHMRIASSRRLRIRRSRATRPRRPPHCPSAFATTPRFPHNFSDA
ncbi:hypothetical protein GY45DRAFT_1320145 [Cubamyces sp. BRFM 1775]|nr:hypothetical protein GY45DRAFT_1320145 [Cubamyces sp. BRFM 1775]